MVNVTCLKCGKRFTAKRKSAKYCSPSCRSGYHQVGNQIDMDMRTINECLFRIAETARKHPELITSRHSDALHNQFLNIERVETAVNSALFKKNWSRPNS